MRGDASGTGGVPGPGRPYGVPGQGEASWQAARVLPAGCDHPHGRSGGILDERARRLSHTELAVAEQLRGEGHAVRSLPERVGRGPIADLQVCGQPVEVKSWMPLADRSRPPTSRSVYNKLASARSQAPTVIVWGVDAGLTSSTAHAGMAAFAARGHWGGLRAVRVIGEGFDLAWQRSRGIDRGGRPGAGPQVPTPGKRPPARGLGW